MTKRVFVLGLDGATWDLMDPWIADGKLPNLGRLVQNGASGPLRSTIHPVTTPAWTSFLTGQQQGRHGIYDHVRRRTGSYKIELTNAFMLTAPLIFDHLGRHNMRSISVNVPYTYPPRPIPGLLVSGFWATIVGPEITQPPSLWNEIAQIIPDYVVHPDFDPQSADPLIQFLDDYLTGIRNRYKLTKYLLEKEDWSFGMTVFMATDQIQHAYWHFMNTDPDDARGRRLKNAIYEVYKTIDDGLADLLSTIGPDTLVITVSDHGAGELHRFVHLNRWLSDQGYLTFKQSTRNVRSQMVTKFASLYKAHVPASIRFQVRKRLGMGFERAKSEMESQLFASPIDWSRSQAYSLGACGNIFINLSGREPDGVVAPGDEYELVRDRIVQDLGELSDPETGERLVKRVYRREEIYSGPFVENAPDLVIEWKDYRYWGRGRYDQNMPPLLEEPGTWDFSDLPLTSTHRPHGILIVNGPGVAQGKRIADAHLIDLVPTILAYLDLPLPSDLDGRVLADLFQAGCINPQVSDETDSAKQTAGDFEISKEDEEKVLKRLEDLVLLCSHIL